MSVARWLQQRLANGAPLLLDGALGTELERLGVRSELPLWSAIGLLEAPDQVYGIHRSYADAGAEILTAATFRTQRHTLERAGHGTRARARALTQTAIELARKAASERPASGTGPGRAERIVVAGSAATLEDCFRPDLVPDRETLRREHADHAENLAAAGADLILIETINTIREAQAAAEAARRTALPFFVSFVADREGRLFSGEALADAVRVAEQAGAAAVLVNCVPPSSVPKCLPALQNTRIPFGIYANLGLPDPRGDWSESQTPQDFAALASQWTRDGARIVGGCCGTRPEHVAAMASALRAELARKTSESR